VKGSCTKKHPQAQQVKVGTSIHLSLDALEFIDFALRLPVAVLGRLSRANRIKVSQDSRRETLQFLDAAGFRFL